MLKPIRRITAKVTLILGWLCLMIVPLWALSIPGGGSQEMLRGWTIGFLTILAFPAASLMVYAADWVIRRFSREEMHQTIELYTTCCQACFIVVAVFGLRTAFFVANGP